MPKDYLGIDIAKGKYDLAYLRHDGEIIRSINSNDSKAHKSLVAELINQDVHVIMEATGTYHQKL